MAAAHADRNLVLGVLALQLDFVGRDALLAAMNAWLLDKARPLGAVLVDRGELASDRLALLNALVDEHLRIHSGDPDRSLVALAAGASHSTIETLRQIPDTAVRGVLEAVVSAAGGPIDPSDPLATKTPTLGEATAAGRRFRVLRPYAQGGLGVVSVALDTELRREVALKEIRPSHADDPDSRARFLAEAEITGGLEHPGIVPVYGLGTYDDGRPFYAMRFIKGDSLKEAIAAFHGPPPEPREPSARAVALRGLLRRFLDVCNAIEYAHSRGVLHRDLKPGNIMVGRFGETLVVDWGLAKPLGQPSTGSVSEEPPLVPSSGGGTGPTLHGQAVGTPAYMSPEQARGDLDALGPASDVYSLGATLYVLLTGRPPASGPDVLRRVERGEIPLPRRVNPEVPAALDAICRKAMALRPSDRYASPRALADDLERWLADAPTLAYREPWPRRLGRWRRRHRVLVAALAAGLTALAVGAGGLWFQARQAKARDRGRALSLAAFIAEADTTALPGLIGQVSGLRPYIDNALRDRLEGDRTLSPAARRNLLLAMVPGDPSRIPEVLESELGEGVSADDLAALAVMRRDLGLAFSAAVWDAIEDLPTTDRALPHWLRAVAVVEPRAENEAARWRRLGDRIASRLRAAPEPQTRRVLLLALGSIPEAARARPSGLVPTLQDWYREDPDPGVHSAIAWVFRRWGRDASPEVLDRDLAGIEPEGDRRWYVGRDGQTYAILPAGQAFRMGTPPEQAGTLEVAYETPHTRRIARAFAIATTEVTRARFEAFLEDTGTDHYRVDQAHYGEAPDAPVLSVTWYEALKYCRWLSEQEDIPEAEMCYPPIGAIGPGMPPVDEAAAVRKTGYRLPTEGEWECACRAGTSTLRPLGDGDSLLGLEAWWAGNSGERAHPVGRLLPNRWGLFDMLGNVAEWCQDAYRPYSEGGVTDDPPAGVPSPSRIQRGGGFAFPASAVRSGLRDHYHPLLFNATGGFRVARTLPRPAHH